MRIRTLPRMLLLVAASGWLALPASHVEASTFAQFTRVLIESPDIDAPVSGSALGDIDGDGNPDIAAGDGGDHHHLYWYQYPSWSKHLISERDGGGEIRLADVNNDGSLDVVTACGNGLDGIAWYENPRGHGGNPAADRWRRHVIEDSVHWQRGHDLLTADL